MKKRKYYDLFNKKWNAYFGRLKSKPVIDGNQKPGFMDKMQLLGKTFMLPIATLSFCGILLGVGSGIANISGVAPTDTSVGIPWLYKIFTFISDMGNIGFIFLPFTFAMAIPIGLCKENKGIAGLAAFIAYGTLIAMTATMVKILPESLTQQVVDQDNNVIPGEGGYIGKALKTVLGFKTLDYGVLGGIFTGLLVWKIHDKFQNIKLPSGIAFWGGTRFVPLFSLLVFSGISIVMVFAWPGINLGLIGIGKGLSATSWGAPIIFQLLVVFTRPAGLHHVMNSVVRFTSAGGTWIDSNGQIFEGALNIFKAQFAEGGVNNVILTPMMASILSGGYMPIMIFGLPAVALAIYLNAPKENRKMVASVVVPGCIATAIGGISEPIEFLFLFVSPLLYVFHAFLTGLSYMIVGLLGVKIGFTDGNIIDFVVNGLIPGLATRWYFVLAIGTGFFTLYLGIWYSYIKWKHLPVIGNDGTIMKKTNLKGAELASAYLSLLGGKENINSLGNCFSRLRIVLNKSIDISDEQVKNLGAIGFKKIGETSLQIVIGPQVEALAIDIRKEMNN